MLNTIFGWIKDIFTFCFGTLNTVWSAIGGVSYVFLAAFIMYTVYRFLIQPVLGGNGIVTPSGWKSEQRPPEKERYQNTGIGFTARW